MPPVETEAQGEAVAHYDTETRHLSWTIIYSGLSGPATGVHFHGPARPGHSADLELPVLQPLESPIEGEADLTEEQSGDLLAGRWYVEVHTGAYPRGEIRGQLVEAF